jgi:hypothetical protein
MAPEVILTEDSKNVYTTKADIWSIGITAIEIAEKNPPLSDIHPMRALKMIPTSDMGLSNPKAFSPQLVEFVNTCLTKDPSKRPTASQMLAGSYMSAAAGLDRTATLQELVVKVMTIKEKKKAGTYIEEDEDDENIVSKIATAAVKVATHRPQTPSTKSSVQHATAAVEIQITNGSDIPLLINKVQDKRLQLFEPVPVLSFDTEILSAAFLDNDYLLLACEKGLFFVDMTASNEKALYNLLPGLRVKQIFVVEKYNCLIALSGKRDHVRQYSLQSIRKLILYNLKGMDPNLLENLDFSKSISQATAKSIDEDYMNLDGEKNEDKLLSDWTSDFIKIPETTYTESIEIEETETSIYMSVLRKKELTLFEWAKEPYLKFMKLKVFWLPEQPFFVSLAQDGMEIKDVYLGYSEELNLVNIDDSKVKGMQMHPDFKQRGFNKNRWRSFVQIPFTDDKLGEILKENMRYGTVNRKVVAAQGVTQGRQISSAPIYFLATFNRMTRVVDKFASPMQGSGVGGWKDGVIWSEAPISMFLRPFTHVISIGESTIEIVDWKSADLRQRLHVDNSAKINILSKTWQQSVLSVSKKRKGCSVYILKENTKPRKPGSLLEDIKSSPDYAIKMKELSLDTRKRRDLSSALSGLNCNDFLVQAVPGANIVSGPPNNKKVISYPEANQYRSNPVDQTRVIYSDHNAPKRPTGNLPIRTFYGPPALQSRPPFTERTAMHNAGM